MSGWIAGECFSLNRGRIVDAKEVRESPGFEGDMVTTVAETAAGNPLRFMRKGRVIYATRAEAIRKAKAAIA